MALSCLIVDDNAAFLQAARTLLEREGIEVAGVASTTAQALCCAREAHPDVTLLDIDLGDESGFELARRLHDSGMDPGHIIMISAHAEEDVADLVEASPALGFVSKVALSARAIRTMLQAAGDGSSPDGASGS